jgi:hypothetical protein
MHRGPGLESERNGMILTCIWKVLFCLTKLKR